MADNNLALAAALRAMADAMVMTAASSAGAPPLVAKAAPNLVDQGAQAVANRKRKPSSYNRRYAAAYRRIKRSKTLKSGKMAKGFSGTSGHKKIVKLAHAAAKKKGRKK